MIMDGVSADPQQKFQSAHQLSLSPNKPSFRNLDIPPRKLLTRRLAALSSEPSMEIINYHHYQHQKIESPEETLFHKFLANSAIDSYSSDEFRMYEFKIRKCTRSRSHDWTDCPFAHPGEKARRRCPRRFSYSGTVCADFRRGTCIRGDGCEFAHGVFECWLHPSRYRTEACKDGKNCQRKICFFAHTASQLRSPPPSTEMVVSVPNKQASGRCAYCRCQGGIRHTTSPTSILYQEKLSPPSSGPISPAQTGGFSPISRFSDRLVRTESCGITQHAGSPAGCSYKDARKELMTPQAIEELMHNMRVMDMNAIDEVQNSNSNIWLDSLAACDDDQQSFFSSSPSTPFPSAMNNLNKTPVTGSDVKWVNDLTYN